MVQVLQIGRVYYSFSKFEEVPILLSVSGSIKYFFGMLKKDYWLLLIGALPIDFLLL